MTALEALRLQVDTLTREKERMEAENLRLRDGNPTRVTLEEVQTELESSKEEISHLTQRLEEVSYLEQQLSAVVQERDQLIQHVEMLRNQPKEVSALQEVLAHAKQDVEEVSRRAVESEERVESLTNELAIVEEEHERAREQAAQQAQLRLYEAMDAERTKWETREQRLVEQLSRLQTQLKTAEAEKSTMFTVATRNHDSSKTGTDENAVLSEEEPDTTRRQRTSAASLPLSQNAETSAVQISRATLAQQLPPIPRFTGEEHSHGGENVEEWLEQFEMVSSLGGWDKRTKLVNLTTRLRGQAYALYRFCTLQQRVDYDVLVRELSKRFMPVYLPAVQSSLFHERKQKMHESVDDFAQELRRLFHHAYPVTQQGSREAEEMGRTVLVNQFISGLLPELKTNVVGSEGDFDQALTKARFEEAKLRDIPRPASHRPIVRHSPANEHSRNRAMPTRPRGSPPVFTNNSTRVQGEPTRCFNCGKLGHIARNCQLRRRHKQEARGMNLPPSLDRTRSRIAAVVQLHGFQEKEEEQKTDNPWLPTQEQLPRQQEEPVNVALDRVSATMHGLSPTKEAEGMQLGPTLMSQVEIEGVPVKALLDTGSPATIISLDLIVEVLAKQRSSDQTPEQWKEPIKKRLEPSVLKLQSYGGGQLDLIRQIRLTLSRGQYKVHAVLQVQKDAPVGLLLRTDLLPHLGFAFLESGTETSWRNLLQGCPWDKFTEKSNRDSTDTSGSVTTNQASSSQRDVKITITDCEAAEQEVERGKLDQPPPDIVTGDQTPITTGAVRLLQAVRFPAQHKKMLRARVEGLQGYPLALFEPDPELTKARGLSMPEALVELDENRCITLVLENGTLEPTRLKKGRILEYLRVDTTTIYPRRSIR